MKLDLQKLVLKRLLKSQNHDLYTKLSVKYFTGANLILFSKITNFYKNNMRLPSMDEFSVVKKDVALQEYLENQIFSEENENDTIQNEFLVSQLQDYFVREETIDFLNTFLEQFENLESVEIMDLLQNHLLELNKANPSSEECFDVAELDLIPKGDSFVLHASGLSTEYDSVNGGFGRQELILLGGRRGSGKSIISLNLAHHRFKNKNTVAVFSIEMRYKEVHDRLVSMISGVPFLNILKNELSPMDKIAIAKAKIESFYERDEKVDKLLEELGKDFDFNKFETLFNAKKPPFKKHRLFIIDDSSLTLNRIDHYCNMFSSKYDNFTMAEVDYLNIIKYPDGKNWMSQIEIADELKRLSRKYDLSMVSPYQIDATGEARFAKGILDSADRGFNFFPPSEEDPEGGITIHTTKIRNGRKMNFDVPMDWSCVRINPASTKLINEKPHNSVVYGSQESEQDLG